MDQTTVKYFPTKYSKAIHDYLISNDHATAVKAMEKQGMKQPYIDNILSLAFMAGWNAK